MSGLPLWAYGAIFLGAASLALVFTPLALRVAVRTKVLDVPGGHKTHASPVPYLGGIAIVVAFAVAVVAAGATQPTGPWFVELVWIVGIAVALSLIGLADDLRGLPVWPRLVAQTGAGIAVWWIGAGAQTLPNEPLNALVTIVWIVLITNAFNLLDNMDGLSAGIAAIAAVGFFVLGLLHGQFLVAALAAGIAGCAAGFLRHNFHPARIYMGDAGSLFLGFMLAVIAIRLRFDIEPPVSFFVVALVLGVAIFDTVLVSTTRVIHRRSPLQGGRDHTSHRLVFIGIPVPTAVALIYAAGIASVWLAVIMSRLDVGTAWILLGFVTAVALFFGVLLGLVPVYETSRRRRLMLREVRERESRQSEVRV